MAGTNSVVSYGFKIFWTESCSDLYELKKKIYVYTAVLKIRLYVQHFLKQ